MLACQLRQAASALPLSSNAVLSLCHSFADVMPKGNAYMASVLVIGRDGIYGRIRHFGQAKIVRNTAVRICPRLLLGPVTIIRHAGCRSYVC